METTSREKFKTVDEYLSTIPENVRYILEELRKTIQQAAPQAKELISYNMPAYKMNGVLVYFAANKEHIGFYPTSSPLIAFKDELTDYKTSKGAIQFPIKSGIPLSLVEKIVRFRLEEDQEKAKSKKNRK